MHPSEERGPSDFLRLGKYLSHKLREKLALQLAQTRDLMTLTLAAGAQTIIEWLKLDIDEDAPTPGTYQERRSGASTKSSVYVLDASHGMSCLNLVCRICLTLINSPYQGESIGANSEIHCSLVISVLRQRSRGGRDVSLSWTDQHCWLSVSSQSH